jgi:hypothetical protein
MHKGMAFGLSVAPKIMGAIMQAILEKAVDVQADTDSYIDDVLVDERVVQAERVELLLAKYGLVSKPIERMGPEGLRVLGLRVFRSDCGLLRWRRDGPLQYASKSSFWYHRHV